MSLIDNVKKGALIAVMCMGLVSGAQALEWVSVKGRIVNMRAGPSTNTEVLWELDRGYPLQVLQRRGSWLQVRDFENDRGWVARSLTARTPYHVVKAKVANIRRGPGLQHRIVGKAERFELMRTRTKKSGWVQVQRSNGQKGWISKRLLWGW